MKKSLPPSSEDYWGDKLKDLIKGRIAGDSFGRLVVRPDSGDPAETCKAKVFLRREVVGHSERLCTAHMNTGQTISNQQTWGYGIYNKDSCWLY